MLKQELLNDVKRMSKKMTIRMLRLLSSFDELEDKEQRVLGEIWDRADDTILLKFDALIHHGGVRETLAELRTRFWVSKE